MATKSRSMRLGAIARQRTAYIVRVRHMRNYFWAIVDRVELLLCGKSWRLCDMVKYWKKRYGRNFIFCRLAGVCRIHDWRGNTHMEILDYATGPILQFKKWK